MSLPHILLIPGFWEGPSVYESVLDSLRHYGYSTQTIPLSSTGHASPNNPSMKDDVASIRSFIAPLIEEEAKEILLVLHSAGAFLGCMAIEGLSLKEREGKGQRGGVKKIVFLSGAIWQEGFQHGPLPFFDYQVRISIRFFFGGSHIYSALHTKFLIGSLEKRVNEVVRTNEYYCFLHFVFASLPSPTILPSLSLEYLAIIKRNRVARYQLQCVRSVRKTD